MTIRRATEVDVDAIVQMGEHFLTQSEYASMLSCEPEALRAFAGRCVRGEMAESDILVAEADDGQLTGMIGVIVAPHPFSGERVAGDLFWWVEPDARGQGIRLLKAAEAWARERQAVKFQMVAPNARVAQLYRRLGFQPLESTYQRSL